MRRKPHKEHECRNCGAKFSDFPCKKRVFCSVSCRLAAKPDYRSDLSVMERIVDRVVIEASDCCVFHPESNSTTRTLTHAPKMNASRAVERVAIRKAPDIRNAPGLAGCG